MSSHRAEGLSVVLPVYNQAGTIERVLSLWSALLEKLGRDYEIVLVDDGSTDATSRILSGPDGAAGAGPRIANLIILHHAQRQGLGASLRAGIAAAKQPLIFVTGCDYAYNPADLKTLLEHMNHADPETGKKIDVVNGYRARTPISGWRKSVATVERAALRVILGLHTSPSPGWLGKSGHRTARLLRILFGLRIGDVDSRFKLFRKSVFDRFPIQSDGDFVFAEILAKANFLGCLMDEVPIAVRPGPFPAHAEPASPTSRWREMRRVFSSPVFAQRGFGVQEV